MPPIKPSIPLPARYSGPYKLLGQGGFGAVWRAHDSLRDRAVAIKVPFREDGDLLRDLAVELQAAARVRHRGIVEVLDACLEPGRAHLVFDYAEAGSLRSIQDDRSLSWPELLPLLLDLLEALGYAHARGVVHRDIKSENVLLRRDGGQLRPQLADFGLAKLARQRGSYEPTRLGAGTLLYMAPECFAADLSAVHPAVDLYAFGVLLHLLVDPVPPWKAQDLSLVLDKVHNVPRPPQPDPALRVPPGVSELVARLLLREPAARPRCARDVADVLREVSGLGSDAIEPSQPPDVEPAKGQGDRAIALVGVTEPLLVDRGPERARLWSMAARSSEEARGVTLIGSPGLGRSRLAAWLAATLHEEGLARPLHIRLTGGPSPTDAVARTLRVRYALADARGDELRSRLQAWLGEGPGHELLAGMLDPDLSSHGLQGGGALASALLPVLRLEPGRWISCVVLEEQRPTGGVADLARNLLAVAGANGIPMLVLHEPADGVETPEDFEQVQLEALPETYSRSLASDICPDGVDEAAAVRASRGVPRLMVEWIRLRAAELSQASEGGGGSEGTGRALQPNADRVATLSLGSLAEARIDAFLASDPQGAREALLSMLVLLPGPAPTELLQAAFEPLDVGPPPIREAVLAGVLREGERRRVGFGNPGLVEGASKLEPAHPKRLRRGLTDALLAWPDRGVGERLATGRLLLDLGDWRAAADEAASLGRAQARRDAAAAMAGWSLALEALDAAPEDDRERVEARLGLVRAARAAGDLDRASVELRRVDPDRLSPELRAETLEVRASLDLLGGETEGALADAERARDLREDLADPAGRSRAVLLQAAALFRLGRRPEALQRFEEAVKVAHDADAAVEELSARWRYGRGLWASGRKAEARDQLERALSSARDQAALGDEGVVLRELGNLDIVEGRHAEAADRLAEAADRLEAAGRQAERASVRNSLGELYRDAGDLVGARREYSAALGLSRAFKVAGDSLVHLLNLAMTELEMGRGGAAGRRLQAVDELIAPGRSSLYRPYIEAIRFGVLAYRDEWPKAEQALDGLLASLEDASPSVDLLKLVQGGGVLAVEAGEVTVAVDALEVATSLAEALGDEAAMASIREVLTGLV